MKRKMTFLALSLIAALTMVQLVAAYDVASCDLEDLSYEEYEVLAEGDLNEETLNEEDLSEEDLEDEYPVADDSEEKSANDFEEFEFIFSDFNDEFSDESFLSGSSSLFDISWNYEQIFGPKILHPETGLFVSAIQYAGNSVQLALIIPDDLEIASIEWGSLNPDIMSVSATGYATALSPGVATVFATVTAYTPTNSLIQAFTGPEPATMTFYLSIRVWERLVPAPPETPEEPPPDANGRGTSPQTGDFFSILPIIMMILSLGTISGVLVYRHKKRQ